MSRIGLPPSPLADCLERPYPSSQKGGTLIAIAVTDLETHERFLSDPDHYRVSECPTCGHDKLHVHDYRQRILRAELGRTVTLVLRFRCANRDCGAKWQVLPQVIARHLHRSWPVVEAVVTDCPRANRPVVPKRTRLRWLGRLRTSARRLVRALARSGLDWLKRLAEAVGVEASRAELVARFGRGLAALAALVHLLVPGVRLM